VVRRVLIIDDNVAFRATVRRLLEREGFVVVVEVGSGLRGLDEAKRQKPDLVLLDVQLPDLDGFEVAERLARLDQPPGVILVSSLDSSDFGALVASSPALGFIPKAELSITAIEELVVRSP
jgi:CheY-like chemotaxis protein